MLRIGTITFVLALLLVMVLAMPGWAVNPASPIPRTEGAAIWDGSGIGPDAIMAAHLASTALTDFPGPISTTSTLSALGNVTFGANNDASQVTLYPSGSGKGTLVIAPTANNTANVATTLQNGQAAGATTITLPAATCTLPGLGLANSWSAANTFTSTVWFGAAGQGLYFGAGTSSSAMSNSTADGTVGKFYTASSATSGDNRGLYWKHDLTGAGASGDAARFYGVAKAAVANIQGMHATGQIGTAGSVTGEVVGARATAATSTGLTLSGGTMYALRVDSDLSSAVTGLTTAAFIGIHDVNGTNKMPYFLDFDASATACIAADTSNLPAAATHKIKCRVGGTDFYLIGVADF